MPGMRERPSGLSDDDLVRGLAEGWGLRARSVDYLPVGAGGYHWAVSDGVSRWFATVNAGADPAALERALGTALALALPFVLAPLPTLGGSATWQLTGRHTLSVYPMVDGVAGAFGPHSAQERDEVLDLVIALHHATPAASTARTDLRLPGRAGLEDALSDLGGPWTGGPYSEPARAVLAAHAGRVAAWLAEFDELAAAVRGDAGWVVTHGEPHPGNVLRTVSGPLLIDWDTVLLAPPERDLWMLTSAMIGAAPDPGDDEAVLTRYERETGHAVRREGIAFYRLWWILADIAIYTDELRRPHVAGIDRADSLTCLISNLEE